MSEHAADHAARPDATIVRDSPARPATRPTTLTALQQSPGSGYSRDYLRESVLAWARSKWPELFAGRDAGEAGFEGRGESSRVQVAHGRRGSSWWFRGVRPDLTGSRLWETRILFVGEEERDLLLVGTGYFGDADARVLVAQPAFVCPLVEHLPFDDGGYPVCTTPRHVLDDAALANFRDHLLSPRRTLPVLALGAHPTSSESRDRDEARLPDARSLARRLCGLAHVVSLGPLVLGRLERWLESELALQAGEARLFLPALEESPGPRRHPRFSRSRAAATAAATGDVGAAAQAATYDWSVAPSRRLDFDALWASVAGAASAGARR